MNLEIPYSIEGIPCLLKVWYEPGLPEISSGSPDRWRPQESPVIEFEVCDRKGYTANWLENKLSERDKQEIKEYVLEYLQ